MTPTPNRRSVALFAAATFLAAFAVWYATIALLGARRLWEAGLLVAALAAGNAVYWRTRRWRTDRRE